MTQPIKGKTREEALKLIGAELKKMGFDGATPAPGTTPPAGAPPAATGTDNAQTAMYNVDGGAPVYVNISDDGIPGIEQGDSVYTDAAMTIPYVDGTYNVTGTTFGFTVAGGFVSAVNDPTGMGAGTPATPAAAAAPPAGAPPVDPNAQFAAQFKELQTQFGAHQTAFAAQVQLFKTQQAQVDKLINIVGQLASMEAGEAAEPGKGSFREQLEEKGQKRSDKIANIAAAFKKTFPKK